MRWTVLSGGMAWLAAAGLVAACSGSMGGSGEPRVAMAPTSFNEIAGWADDKHGEALVAFRRSCPKLVAGPDTKIATDGGSKTITAAEWKQICDAAGAVKVGDGIIVATADQQFIYRVAETQTVVPQAVEVLDSTDSYTLTLITCVPDGVYSHRLVVRAERL